LEFTNQDISFVPALKRTIGALENPVKTTVLKGCKIFKKIHKKCCVGFPNPLPLQSPFKEGLEMGV